MSINSKWSSRTTGWRRPTDRSSFGIICKCRSITNSKTYKLTPRMRNNRSMTRYSKECKRWNNEKTYKGRYGRKLCSVTWNSTRRTSSIIQIRSNSILNLMTPSSQTRVFPRYWQQTNKSRLNAKNKHLKRLICLRTSWLRSSSCAKMKVKRISNSVW